MSRLLRCVATAAAVVAVATAGSSGAVGAKPQITDPAGDEIGMQAGTDVVSTTFDTAGKGVGKKYVPEALVVTMTLGAPVMKQQGIRYAVTASAPGCSIIWSYAPGSSLQDGGIQFTGCGDPSTVPGDSTPSRILFFTPKTVGKTIVWSLKFKAIPKEVRPGVVLSALRANVHLVEPVFGLIGTNLLDDIGVPVGIDLATTDAEWKIH